MDGRHYETPEIKKCECSEDDNCGCTYPNNMRHYENTKEIVTKIVKDSVCICTPNECACSIEQTEIDS